MSLFRVAPCLERPHPAVTKGLPGNLGLLHFHRGQEGTRSGLPTQHQASQQTMVLTGLNLISLI